jgi:hypothetical protein
VTWFESIEDAVGPALSVSMIGAVLEAATLPRELQCHARASLSVAGCRLRYCVALALAGFSHYAFLTLDH